MPYSQQLGLIYIGVPKTGSTSVTRALKTWQSAVPEDLQFHKGKVDKTFREGHRIGRFTRPWPWPHWQKHLSAAQIQYLIGKEEFSRCTSFTTVRNPWARLVSIYFFTHKDNEPSAAEKSKSGAKRRFHNREFEPWIRRRWLRHKLGLAPKSQLSMLVDKDSQLLVDHIGRLEEIQQTLDWVSEDRNLQKIEAPHVNGTRQGHYAQFYTPDTRDMVAEMCQEDIEYFNYSFD